MRKQLKVFKKNEKILAKYSILCYNEVINHRREGLYYESSATDPREHGRQPHRVRHEGYLSDIYAVFL